MLHYFVKYHPSMVTFCYFSTCAAKDSTHCYCQKLFPCRKGESASLNRVYYITLSLCFHRNIVWINGNSKEEAFYSLSPSIFKIRTHSGVKKGEHITWPNFSQKIAPPKKNGLHKPRNIIVSIFAIVFINIFSKWFNTTLEK